MMKRLVILGSTGSIGTSTLDLVTRFPDRFGVVGLGAGENLDLLVPQIERFRPALVAVRDDEIAARLAARLGRMARQVEIVRAAAGMCRLATMADADMVVSAVVGAVGLEPTYAALAAGKQVALANKESMVMAGRLLNETARAAGGVLLPLDSEHSAIWQSLHGERRSAVRRLTLTASGGPFYHLAVAELARVTPAEACRHPRWRMGQKISIDSATLMNKALEIIEACRLFEEDPERIAAVIHPQSIVHSLVEFCDGAVIAHLARPDMRLPIAYALHYPERMELPFPRLDLVREGPLEFIAVDPERFPAIGLAHRALALGDAGTIALNAANEVAVERFIAGRLPFPAITGVVAAALDRVAAADCDTIAEALEIDRRVRVDLEENPPLGNAY
ncbi:MAG: 1-deoxy-D-xylulose-5-phosphate reductoisomerase [Deltaproteobacteria bacterium]|nr:1-deoxy-D-xylulose-5-phosphate reductoisomerase [Candidatus Anaeroferrophillacea bacterium]